MLELEPFDSLALTLHHSPGACALLLGSGLSRSAGISTGWEITLDLVRRVASLQGTDASEDPAAWYRQTYSGEPNYSVLLDAIASTPSERRAVLHAYIEPSDEEEGRRPTAAHRAIAQLVARGAVRVIVTTNFDRLLEQALVAEGIQPTVINGDDTLAGAVPLIHARCTVLKVHGDYLDTRIRNIDAELSSYTPPIDHLLDQIFDTFGLLVCGWSGEWDIALRAAILRAPGRRYPTYWASYGEPAALARDLIEHRSARIVPIAGADPFFIKLNTTVEALAQANRPHPTSIHILVAQAKRLCGDDAYSIAWADLLFHEAQCVRQKIDQLPFYAQYPTNELGRSAVAELVATSERLRRILLVCGRWGTAKARYEVANTISALAAPKIDASSYVFWSSLRTIPATLCFYWYCIGAMASSEYEAIKCLFVTKVRGKTVRESLLEMLPPTTYESIDGWKFLNGQTALKLPASNYFGALIGPESADMARTQEEGETLFDRFETLVALEFAHIRLAQQKKDTGLWFWTPVGKFLWRSDQLVGLGEFEDMTQDNGYVAAGFFDGRLDAANEAVVAVKAFIRQANLDW